MISSRRSLKGKVVTDKKNVRIAVLALVAFIVIAVPQYYSSMEEVFYADYYKTMDLAVPSVVTTAAGTVWDPKLNPLGIPPGKAQNLPSPRMQDSSAVDKKRGGYGGAGDEQHLGGFGEIDAGGISPGLFKHMISNLGIKSVMDIGCGRGFSTSWFYFHGCDGKCKLFCYSCVR